MGPRNMQKKIAECPENAREAASHASNVDRAFAWKRFVATNKDNGAFLVDFIEEITRAVAVHDVSSGTSGSFAGLTTSRNRRQNG